MGLAPHDTVQSQATTDGPQMTQTIGNLRDTQKPFRTMCVKLSLTGTIETLMLPILILLSKTRKTVTRQLIVATSPS